MEEPKVVTQIVVKEEWLQRKWRPMMAVQYMVVCMFDFIMAPILWSLIQAIAEGKVDLQWTPLTLQGAGLYHMAMGAILGIAAFTRGQEKVAQAQAENSNA